MWHITPAEKSLSTANQSFWTKEHTRETKFRIGLIMPSKEITRSSTRRERLNKKFENNKHVQTYYLP